MKETGKSCGDRWEDGWILDGEIGDTDGDMQKEIYCWEIELATHGEGEREWIHR